LTAQNLEERGGQLHPATATSATTPLCRQVNHIQSIRWTIKNAALYFCPYLHQLMTNFQTYALCEQFAIMWLLYIPPHHKYVFTHYLVKYE